MLSFVIGIVVLILYFTTTDIISDVVFPVTIFVGGAVIFGSVYLIALRSNNKLEKIENIEPKKID